MKKILLVQLFLVLFSSAAFASDTDTLLIKFENAYEMPVRWSKSFASIYPGYVKPCEDRTWWKGEEDQMGRCYSSANTRATSETNIALGY